MVPIEFAPSAAPVWPDLTVWRQQSSSAEEEATFARASVSALPFAIVASIVLIACSDSAGGARPNEFDDVVVAPLQAGGTVTGPAGTALSVPRGGLAGDVVVTMAVVALPDEPLDDGWVPVGPAVSVSSAVRAAAATDRDFRLDFPLPDGAYKVYLHRYDVVRSPSGTCKVEQDGSTISGNHGKYNLPLKKLTVCVGGSDATCVAPMDGTSYHYAIDGYVGSRGACVPDVPLAAAALDGDGAPLAGSSVVWEAQDPEGSDEWREVATGSDKAATLECDASRKTVSLHVIATGEAGRRATSQTVTVVLMGPLQ